MKIQTAMMAVFTLVLSTPVLAVDGDRAVAVENHLDQNATQVDKDRVGAEKRLDARGERIEKRMDRRADRARANGHEKRAEHLEKKGKRIHKRLDRRGERIEERREHRVEERHEHRAEGVEVRKELRNDSK